MKISVLVPVYKCEQFIEKCCESLFAQTLDSIEYVFISDDSPDDSINIIKNTLDKFPHRKQYVKIATLSENRGVAYVRNQLLKEACGEYILYVDSDDWIETDALELLYRKAKESDAEVVSFGFYCENRKRTTIRTFSYPNIEKCLKDVIGNNWGVVWRFLFKKDIAVKNKINFPDGLQGGEDYVFCVKYLSYARRIVTMKRPLYHYVTYNSSSLISSKNMDSLVDQFKATEIVEDFLQQQSLLCHFDKALNKRKYYVKAAIDSFLFKKWGNLFSVGCGSKCNYYLLKMKNLYSVLIGKIV